MSRQKTTEDAAGQVLDLPFRPRARLLQLLGDELIGSPRLAIFELVKNAYDADAGLVRVALENIERPNASIVVEDDGNGMTLETIRDIWLVPGHDHRARQRAALQRTRRGRLPLGEKGVGRFAAHKLGNRIEVVTRARERYECVVSINWAELIRRENLSDAVVTVTERDPLVFRGDQVGTCITISELQEMSWTRGEVRRLHRQIASISSPFEGRSDEFSPWLEVPGHEDWVTGVPDVEALLKRAPWKFLFRFDGGRFDWQYDFRGVTGIKLERRNLRNTEQPLLIRPERDTDELGIDQGAQGSRPPPIRADASQGEGIGSVKGEFYVFDRDPAVLRRLGESQFIKSYLDENGGVRVYRDGIRVYNYGESGDDWLGLDLRRVNTPARGVSRNIVVGAIELSLEDSQDPNMTENCITQMTVMGGGYLYGNGCIGVGGVEAPNFSNPDLFFPPPDERYANYPFQPNTPMGVPGDEFTSALDGPVNAARAIDEAWDTIASLSEPPATSLPAWWRRSCAEGDVPTAALSSKLPAGLTVRPSGEATRFAFSVSAPTQCANDQGARLRVRSLGSVQGLARSYRASMLQAYRGGLERWKDEAAFGVAADVPARDRQRLSMSAEPHYGACGASRKALATVELVHTVDGGITLQVAGVPRVHMALEQGSGRPYCEGASAGPLRHMGDFNGDGRADVLLRHGDGRWHYYPMDGANVLPGAGAANLPRNPAVAVVGVGDLNGDGRDDVLMRLRSGTWRYYPMNGRRVVAGRGAVALPKDTAWQLEGIGDFNDDGKDDVLLRRRGGRLVRSNGELQNVDEWRYYPMDGRRVLEGGTPALLDHNFGDWVAGVGDFNGDGRDDVLFRLSDGGWYYLPFDGPVGGESTVLPGAGETGGIYVSERVVALPEDMAWSAAGIADFDGDGKDDVLLRHEDGRWRYQPMNGRHVLSGGGAGELPADPEVWLAGVGDMDGDGKAEVLTRRGHGAWRTYHMDPASGALVAGGEVELASGSAWGVLKGGLEDPPRASAAMPDQPIAIDGEATIDLSAYFAGGGALAYSASGDADVVGASVAGNILTLAAAASGHATVTVTAQGANGYFVRQTFRVAVSEDGVAGRRIKDCAECPVVVAVRAGSFMMGAPEEEEGSRSDERPVHRVDIPAFAIGIHEVTFAQWDACVAGGGCDGYEPFSGYHGEARANRPVQELSWHDAQGYVAWLSEHTGEAYRLPSEAEWEYAARAGTTTPFHFGETISLAQAHYRSSVEAVLGSEAQVVGSFPANAWGLHDVHGNISEWTEDCAYGHYADTPTDGSAWETDDCAARVVRGGNWSSLRASVRSASRAASPADERLYRQNGLRVVRVLGE